LNEFLEIFELFLCPNDFFELKLGEGLDEMKRFVPLWVPY